MKRYLSEVYEMEEKLLVLTWTKEQLDAYDDEHDFVKECLNEAAKVIGVVITSSPSITPAA